MSDPFNTSITNENQLALSLYPHAHQRRPSPGWFKSPSYMDGGSDPPFFFPNVQEIHDTFLFHGGDPEVLRNQQLAQLTPTPVNPIPPAPLTPSLVPDPARHYRANTIHASADPAPPAPLLVHVATLRTEIIPASGRVKASSKKGSLVKIQPIVLDGISRVRFLEEAFKAHNLTNHYSPGVHSGPGFKLSWTGSCGGRSKAPTLLNDNEFVVARNAILEKRGKAPQIFAELDLDTMEGFRIQSMAPPRALGAVAEDHEELAYGTRVPHVADFSEVSQIQGTFIVQLKKQWPCQLHPGEHGEPGFCYVNISGAHILLNPRRLKEWAAAMAAGEATKHEPPNSTSFDGARDGRLLQTKARGRSGPNAAAQPQMGVSAESVVQIMAALAPAWAAVNRKRGLSDAALLTPPSRPVAKRAKVLSPLPKRGQELHACLEDFSKAHGIDLTMHEAALTDDDYTPDIISDIDDMRLCDMFKVTNGIVLKFKKFCREWFSRYEVKKAVTEADD